MKFITALFLLLLISCNYFKSAKEPKAIARVDNDFLYEKDVASLIPKGTSKEDSIIIVHNFINQWAREKLLYETSIKNLNSQESLKFDELIEQYKVDLYTKAYLEQLVYAKIDTVISQKDIESYYEKNKIFFKTESELVKLRYIYLVKDNPNLDNIKSKFTSFTKKDKKALQEMSIQFKNYALNDSIWVNINQVYERIPFINVSNKETYISSGINFQYADCTDIWLVKVNQVLPKNTIPPIQYLTPTLKEVILNERKKQFIKNIEQDILKDAIKNNKYEIYK